jgi:hypothetical protein
LIATWKSKRIGLEILGTLGLEIFNLFNNQNAITNTWVPGCIPKNEYAIPKLYDYKSFNVKLSARL